MRASVKVVHGVLWLLFLGSNIAFLLGCFSPALSVNEIYEVDVKNLAENLEAEANQRIKENITLIVGPELPTYWRVGVGGVCDVYEETGEVSCRHTFAPSQGVLSILEACLRDSLSRQDELANQTTDDNAGSLDERVNAILTAWSRAIASLEPQRLTSHEGNATRLVRASAAFIILVIVVDTWGAWCIIVREKNKAAAVQASFGSILCLIAGACTAPVIDKSMLLVAGKHESHVGAAVTTLFVGMICRFVYYGFLILFRGPRRPREKPEPSPYPPVWPTTAANLTNRAEPS
ncbi:hypothetical protein VTJ49DRAFT_1605 [Mycothermus thermophilus]|uniref:Transmembrane protein n=1 Tax=Humicola insolens TaxID=85995 RepID=A0ABR3VBZ3_HUMIN